MKTQAEMPQKGVVTLLIAQFFSAISDNALLIVAIALLEEGVRDPWWVPILKGISIFSFVAFAPWVGIISDQWPKRRIMMFANAMKACACVALVMGLHPFFCFMVLGLGAALYSPAKYGLITELVPNDALVKFNAWIEISTVVAAILGVVLGGWCVSERFQMSEFSEYVMNLGNFDTQLVSAFGVLLFFYCVAGFLNFFIPESGVIYEMSHQKNKGVARFLASNKKLWLDKKGKLSLSVTTLFWGMGATMQLMTLAWARSHLGLTLELSSYVQGVSAIGAILGALLAARWLQLHHAHHLLWIGIGIGALLPAMNWVNSLPGAMLLMGVAGILSGLFIVPMNALLQSRGHKLLSAGESIAVQNFNENFCVLAMMALYGLLLMFEVSIQVVLNIFGLGVIVCMAWIMKEYAKSASKNSDVFN